MMTAPSIYIEIKIEKEKEVVKEVVTGVAINGNFCHFS